MSSHRMSDSDRDANHQTLQSEIGHGIRSDICANVPPRRLYRAPLLYSWLFSWLLLQAGAHSAHVFALRAAWYVHVTDVKAVSRHQSSINLVLWSQELGC